MARRRIRSVAVVAVLAAGALAACDPPPPIPTFTVTVTTDAADAAVGDGICEATAGQGDCTLRAAVEEGNAAGRARIAFATVKDRDIKQGTSSPPWTITGDLEILGAAGYPVGGHFVIAEGASLHSTGLRLVLAGFGGTLVTATYEVHGALVLDRSRTTQVTVASTGVLVTQSSLLWLANDGIAHVRHATLWGGAPIVTGGSGQTFVSSSLIQPTRALWPSAVACSGTPPVSGGYNIASDATCALAGTADLESTAVTAWATPFGYEVAPTGAAVDRIPAGVNGCGTTVTTDLAGSTRPIDVTGGGPACDVGPLERTNAP